MTKSMKPYNPERAAARLERFTKEQESELLRREANERYDTLEARRQVRGGELRGDAYRESAPFVQTVERQRRRSTSTTASSRLDRAPLAVDSARRVLRHGCVAPTSMASGTAAAMPRTWQGVPLGLRATTIEPSSRPVSRDFAPNRRKIRGSRP